METEASATANQPFLNRALRRIRIIWSDLAAMGSRRGRPIRPDLPDGDVERVRELMCACLEDPIVATAARAKAAEIGYLYLTLSESGRHRFLHLLAEDFGLDVAGLRDALAAHADEPSGETYARLQRSARPPRVQLLRIERIDPLADTSARGMRGSFGMMVNYLYDGDRLEGNYELACTGTIAASDAVERQARLGRRDLAKVS